MPERVRPRGLHKTDYKHLRGVIIAVRVRVVVIGGRAVPIVIGPQVMADLVYVRQFCEAVDVDDGVGPLIEGLRVSQDVPGSIASTPQATEDGKGNLNLAFYDLSVHGCIHYHGVAGNVRGGQGLAAFVADGLIGSKKEPPWKRFIIGRIGKGIIGKYPRRKSLPQILCTPKNQINFYPVPHSRPSE